MSNWLVLIACAVVGWLLVSFLFRKKPDRDAPPFPPVDRAGPTRPTRPTGPSAPARPVGRPAAPPSGAAPGTGPGAAPGGQLSVTFLSLKWHELLGVAQSASDAEIDAAYYAIISEFDRLAFDRNATDERKRAALERRHGAAEAYQFIRAARGRR
jgi:hypothetical protein